MEHHTLYFFENLERFVVCCSRDWRFKGKQGIIAIMNAFHPLKVLCISIVGPIFVDSEHYL